MRRLRKFVGLSRSDRLLLLEAWLYLGAARAALLLVPFRRIATHLGQQLMAQNEAPPDLPPPPAARNIAGAVETMSYHTPWESACLAQTIAGKFMLKQRGIPSRLYLGTKKDEAGNLTAHAWLQAGNEIVIGGAGHQTFVVLSAFGDPAG